ncbi:MAG: excinuclease ABC subunit UvrC [Proteobacteria bacterium]|nr:excinuclease ABC subunit UvrC [Pseudomonadota bacterium]
MSDEPMETPQLSPQHGREVLRKFCANMPSTPGVYRMLGADGTVLYVGKAKNLKNRVTSYLNVGGLTSRIQSMISQTTSMEIISTRSEAEALLLEANLIKKFSPRYNILLKDDKSFPYIMFSGDHEFPRLSKHRGAKTKKGKYFGPFVSAGAVNESITILQKAFLLRTCSDSFFKNRTRPCMLYQIKRCSAPCVNKISQEDYARLSAQAEGFLSGKSRQIQDALVAEMQELSLKMQYEKARVLRDRIRALTQVQQQSSLGNPALGDADVIAMARDGAHCCIQLFSFRGGRNYGNRAWFPQHTQAHTDSEIVSTFIGQLYQVQPAPPMILTSVLLEDANVLEEALRMNNERRVDVVHPLRGEKREVVEQAQRNAREALARHLSMNATQRSVLEGIQQLFGLDEMPRRIEVYDNSHIMGTHAVGGMIVAGPEGFMKNEYRKFNIKNTATTPGDDYGMMREVLMRRFVKLSENGEGDVSAADEEKTPDLVLIDGGVGQLAVATALFAELGITDICYAAIAKGPDRNAGREVIHIPGREPFQLEHSDPVLHALQRMRDEAHRFAIGTHRNKRSKAISMSELDTIPSIGPSRKKALLHHFGSAREVAAASAEDIGKVPGISRTMAKIIYSHFHGEE